VSAGRLRATNEEIIEAYRRTGSVWRTGKELGIAGQSVHERLRVLGYPMFGRKWTDDEIDELRSLVGHMTLGEIGHRLGRPYSGVAGKISELGLAGRSYRRPTKIPRGAGYDKASLARYIKQLEESGDPITKFARRNGLGIEPLIGALERSPMSGSMPRAVPALGVPLPPLHRLRGDGRHLRRQR